MWKWEIGQGNQNWKSSGNIDILPGVQKLPPAGAIDVSTTTASQLQEAAVNTPGQVAVSLC